MKIKLLLLTLQVLSFSASGQKGINTGQIMEEFSRYNGVITQQHEDYVFDIAGDSVSIRQNISQQVLVFSENPGEFTNENIYYNPGFNSIKDLNAFTLVPKPRGKGYKRIRVSRFSESHDRDNNIFFSDSRSINFAFPSITRGAFSNMSYTIEYHNPWFLRHSFLQGSVPLLKSRITAKVHKDIEIGYHIYNADGIDLKLRQYSKGNYNYYEWEAENIMPYRYFPSNNFGLRHHSPHIALYVKNALLNGQLSNYYSSVDELYNFYYSLLSDMDYSSSPQMEVLVESITYGLSDWQKARAIYYWVQKNIKYVAYLDGYNGFIPAPPAEVFAKRFGDCKGKSVLIKKMMDLAGLPAYLSWVGTRSIPYTYEQCPLPAVDNHMVVACMLNDTVFIMDGTFNFLDFGVNPFNIQEKEVLISIDENQYQIFRVPASSASMSMVKDSVSITLDEKMIKGRGYRTHTGFNKLELAYALEGQQERLYAKTFTSIFEKGNNKFLIVGYEFENLFEFDTTAWVNYDFIVNDYAVVLDNEIFVNMNLDRSYHNMKVDTTLSRLSPVINDFHFTEKHITRFRIPEGYEVTFIPADDTIIFDEFRASFRYQVQDDYILLEKEIVFGFLQLLDDKFTEWNSFIDSLGKNYRFSVSLKKQSNNL